MVYVVIAGGLYFIASGVVMWRNTHGFGHLHWKVARFLQPFPGWMDRMGERRWCRQQGGVGVVMGLLFVVIGVSLLLS